MGVAGREGVIPLEHALIHEHPQELFASASGLGHASPGCAFRSRRRAPAPDSVHRGACLAETGEDRVPHSDRLRS